MTAQHPSSSIVTGGPGSNPALQAGALASGAPPPAPCSHSLLSATPIRQSRGFRSLGVGLGRLPGHHDSVKREGTRCFPVTAGCWLVAARPRSHWAELQGDCVPRAEQEGLESLQRRGGAAGGWSLCLHCTWLSPGGGVAQHSALSLPA